MIIGISGKRGVGKTTAAKYIKRVYGYEIRSFAATLKEMAKQDFDFTDEQLYGKYKEAPFKDYEWSPREYLLKKGQFMRYFEPDYWIKKTLDDIKPEQNVVIDDLRYLNEAAFLRKRTCKLVRIQRRKKEIPYKSTEFDNDESETQLDTYEDFDFYVNEVENLSLAGLHGKLDYIMENLNG